MMTEISDKAIAEWTSHGLREALERLVRYVEGDATCMGKAHFNVAVLNARAALAQEMGSGMLNSTTLWFVDNADNTWVAYKAIDNG